MILHPLGQEAQQDLIQAVPGDAHVDDLDPVEDCSATSVNRSSWATPVPNVKLSPKASTRVTPAGFW